MNSKNCSQSVSQSTEPSSVHLQKQQILNWSFPPFLEFWMRPGSFYIGAVKNVYWTHATGFVLVNTILRILLPAFLMLTPSRAITWISTPGPGLPVCGWCLWRIERKLLAVMTDWWTGFVCDVFVLYSL